MSGLARGAADVIADMSFQDLSTAPGEEPPPNGAASAASQPDASAASQPASVGQGRVERLFEMTSDLLATISLEGRFTLLNPAWEALLGWTREELQAAPIEEFMHPDDVEQTLEQMRVSEDEREQLEAFTNRYRHRDGSWRWLLWSARRDGDTWYAAVKDVTDRMWLERQALHDPLTKLPNRLLLLDRACQALARLHRSAGVVAMLFIDLDKFKAVNDNLGHETGDRLLVSISERLEELMRDSDTVARLGGDEFVILAEELESEAEALALAAARDRRDPSAVPAEIDRSGDARERGRVGGAQRDADPEDDAARGGRGDVPGEGRGRPARGALRRAHAQGADQRTCRSRARCATRSAGRAGARLPADHAAGGRQGGGLRGTGALATARGRARRLRGDPAGRLPATCGGERADRPDRQLGAAQRVPAG